MEMTMSLKLALQNFISFLAKDNNPLTTSQIEKLKRLITEADQTYDIDWHVDICTLWGDFSKDGRFIIVTNDDYLRLDVRYDLSRQNDYFNRIVYDLDKDFYTDLEDMKSDFQFISQTRTDEEILNWTDYTSNQTTCEESVYSFR
jgi:hypothetical protein